MALAGVAASQSETPPYDPSLSWPAAAEDALATETPPVDSTAKPAATTKPDAAKGKPETPQAKSTLAELSKQDLAQCLRDWEAATHMTRQEWARTCRRVVSNRMQFLYRQGQ
jgi:hypothetical protein